MVAAAAAAASEVACPETRAEMALAPALVIAVVTLATEGWEVVASAVAVAAATEDVSLTSHIRSFERFLILNTEERILKDLRYYYNEGNSNTRAKSNTNSLLNFYEVMEI